MFYIEAKWWVVEIKFERPLKRKEVRVLRRLQTEGTGSIGVDGVIFDQYPEKFPGEYATNQIRTVLSKIKAEAKIRLAPFGRDCPGSNRCSCCPEGREECDLGNSLSCQPILTDSDWKKVSFS